MSLVLPVLKILCSPVNGLFYVEQNHLVSIASHFYIDDAHWLVVFVIYCLRCLVGCVFFSMLKILTNLACCLFFVEFQTAALMYSSIMIRLDYAKHLQKYQYVLVLNKMYRTNGMGFRSNRAMKDFCQVS